MVKKFFLNNLFSVCLRIFDISNGYNDQINFTIKEILEYFNLKVKLNDINIPIEMIDDVLNFINKNIINIEKFFIKLSYKV